MKYELITTAIMAVLTAAVLLCVYCFQGYACTKSWEDSGMKARFALTKGCQVQRKDGTWVPASAVRDVNP